MCGLKVDIPGDEIGKILNLILDLKNLIVINQGISLVLLWFLNLVIIIHGIQSILDDLWAI